MKIDVYADNITKPNTMLLIDGFAGTALYGDAQNNETNQEIRKILLVYTFQKYIG